MSLPLWLDPATLRWVADNKQREAESEESYAESYGAQFPDSPAIRWAEDRAEDRAYALRREAKNLRATATRVERRRR